MVEAFRELGSLAQKLATRSATSAALVLPGVADWDAFMEARLRPIMHISKLMECRCVFLSHHSPSILV